MLPHVRILKSLGEKDLIEAVGKIKDLILEAATTKQYLEFKFKDVGKIKDLILEAATTKQYLEFKFKDVLLRWPSHQPMITAKLRFGLPQEE